MASSSPTPKRRRRQVCTEPMQVRGFFRLQLVATDPDTGQPRIVGDSGWRKNRIPNEGYDNYLTRALSAQAGSAQISRMCLGTGSLIATDATGLVGELNTATYTRTTVTVNVLASTAVQFEATFASSSSHITASVALSCIGIINNTTSAGSLFAGNTYTSSQWNTNQDVYASYRINFA